MFWFFVPLGSIIGSCVIQPSIEKTPVAAGLGFLVGLFLDCLTCLVAWHEWGYRDKEGRLKWRGLRYVLSFWKRPQHQTVCDGCGNFYYSTWPQCPFCAHPASWIGTQEKLESYLEYEKNWTPSGNG